MQKIKTELAELKLWDYNSIHDLLIEYAKKNELKNGTVMWPVRIAVSGKAMTPGGAIEILDILGREEALNRIDKAINLLKGEN